MKRTLLIVLSVLLLASSVYGVIAAGNGMDDVSEILRYKKNQRADIVDFVDVLEERVDEYLETEEGRSEAEKDYATSVVTDKVGSQQLSSGQSEYNAGAEQIAKGQSEYDAAEKLYNEKKAEYEAAERQLHDAENQLIEAKQQRAEGQAQLDAATADYEQAKQFFDKIDELGLTGVEGLVSGILSQFGFTSLEEARAAMKAYEDGQAQIAEADVQIAAAEQQIEEGRAQLDAAKVQLDDGKKQLDAAKAQLDDGKKQLADAKQQLNAGQVQLNQNVAKMNDLKESLAEQDDAKSAVKTGVEALMANDGIAELVEDETDYRAVISAAREYVEEDMRALTAETDTRQSLYGMLRIASIIGALAAVIGIIASLKPTKKLLEVFLAASGITALGCIALNIYGYAAGYRMFVYSLADGTGTGDSQFTAMMLLLAASVMAALMAVVCVKAFARGLSDDAPVRAAGYDYDDEDDEEDDEDDEDDMPARAKPAPAKSEASDIDAMAEETRRLNEEAERLEAQTRQAELDKARREYEEARRRFEQARRNAPDDK